MKHDVIIIGGGAAGLMCAMEAGRRGAFRAGAGTCQERLGEKMLSRSGGRCNFTNVNAGAANYVSGKPDFCKSALARYTPGEFIALVEKHGVAYHEKKLGQLFCDISSRQIVEILQKECAAARVEIRLNCTVKDVRKNACFQLETNQGECASDSLVIATGGLSFAKLGATDFGYRIARQFGLAMIEPRPGLAPLTLSAGDQAAFAELSGISIAAEVECAGVKFRENILFTHRGLSGPAILQISNFWKEKKPIVMNLLPDRQARELLTAERQTNKELKTVLGQYLPQRFVQQWCVRFAPSRPINRFSTVELAEVAQRLHSWEIQPYRHRRICQGRGDAGWSRYR